MPRAALFDLGGVLIDWDPRHLYRDLLDEAAMEEFLAAVATPAWNAEQDRGRAWDDAVAELTRDHPEHAELIAAYHHEWDRMVAGPIEGSVAVLAELRDAGVALYALSNWSAEKFARTRAREEFGFLGWFADLVVSGEHGLIKPDPAIFELALDRFGLSAGDAVFVDDSAPNVAAATALGIPARRFVDPPTLRADLVELDLLPAAAR